MNSRTPPACLAPFADGYRWLDDAPAGLLDPARRWPLAGLTLGAMIYPAGLFIQYFSAEFTGQLVTATGAAMIVVFGTLMTVRFIGALRQRQ